MLTEKDPARLIEHLDDRSVVYALSEDLVVTLQEPEVEASAEGVEAEDQADTEPEREVNVEASSTKNPELGSESEIAADESSA